MRRENEFVCCHSGARRPPTLAQASFGGFEFAEAQSAKAEGANPKSIIPVCPQFFCIVCGYGFRLSRSLSSGPDPLARPE